MRISKVNAIALLAIFISFLALYQFAADKTGYMTGGQVFDSVLKQPIPMKFHDNGDSTYSPSSSSSLIGSGTTETPTFISYTTGTTAIAAGARNLQFIPSTSATGTIIFSGTYSIPGAGNLGVISIPIQAGNTSTSGTIILTSGTTDSIQNR